MVCLEKLKGSVENNSMKIAFFLTLLYFFILLPVIWEELSYWNNLDLNEVGDFLAGIFGPVGFFWLVLGYFQQNKALKLNSEAVEMQANELKNSVKALNLQAKQLQDSVYQQKQMVNLAKSQLELDKQKALAEIEDKRNANTPQFEWVNINEKDHQNNQFTDYIIKFKNTGKDAHTVFLEVNNDFKQTPTSITPDKAIKKVEAGGSLSWVVTFEAHLRRCQELYFRITCLNDFGEHFTNDISIIRNGNVFKEITDTDKSE